MLAEELESLNQVLIFKEKNMDNKLYEICTTLTSLTCSSNKI